MTALNDTATAPAPPITSSLDDSFDKDAKETFEHVETSTALQNSHLQAEADWVRGLNEEEFEHHNRRLVRKVSYGWVRAKGQIDARLLPVLFVLLILNYLDRNALASGELRTSRSVCQLARPHR